MASSTHREPQRPLSKRRLGLLIAIAALAVPGAVAVAVLFPEAFWPGYLVAAVFWLGISLGCLGIGLLHRLTGGNWGVALFPELNAGIATLPVGVLGLAPLFLGAPALYSWAGSESARAALGPHQQSYLAPGAVLARSLIEIVVWCGVGLWVVVGNARSQANPCVQSSPRLAAFGLIALWLSMTFAVTDGLMSLTPAWASSLFGALYSMGFALTGLSFAIVTRSMRLAGGLPLEQELSATHDLGNLLLAFNLLWVYFAFSQYLIIWAGDLPLEVSWYADRRRGWPLTAAAALIVFHFAVPLGCLLSRAVKRDRGKLSCVALLLLVMQVTHLAWTVLPATTDHGMQTLVCLMLSVLAIGSAWVLPYFLFGDRLQRMRSPSDVPPPAIRNQPVPLTGEAP